MKILNQNLHTVSASTQEAIEKQIVSIEFAGDVVLQIANEHENFEPIYSVCSLEGDYLFSIDTDGDVIFER